jgi:F420-non-reducing hydrogenase iron-sulfur subunit
MTLKRIAFLQEILKFVGLDGRLHLDWISSAEARKFVRVISDFTEKIKKLGPSPLSTVIKSITVEKKCKSGLEAENVGGR